MPLYRSSLMNFFKTNGTLFTWNRPNCIILGQFWFSRNRKNSVPLGIVIRGILLFLNWNMSNKN